MSHDLPLPSARGPGHLRTLLDDERLRFLIAGGWNTAFGLAAFAAVHHAAGAHVGPWAVIVLAYAIALPQAFLVQKYCVFRRSGNLRRQWRRFAITNTTIFAANLLVVPLLAATMGWHPVLVQCGFVAASTVISYVVHRHYSFAGAA